MASNDMYKLELSSTLILPKSLFTESAGFACDIGGSLAKFVYFISDTDQDSVTVHLDTFPRENLDDGLKYIQENFVKPAGEKWNKNNILTCGVGSYHFMYKLEDAFNTKGIKNINEDCFGEAFVKLAKLLSTEEVVEGLNSKVMQEEAAVVQCLQDQNKKFKTSPTGDTKPMAEQDPYFHPFPDAAEVVKMYAEVEAIKLPCAIMFIGSGGGVLKLFEDSSYHVLQMWPSTGKYLIGMGKILTGAKTFDDLMELAEKGDSTKVDTVLGDIMQKNCEKPNTKTEDDIYAKFMDDVNNMDNSNIENAVVFTFGKVVDKDIGDFRKEDIARAFVSHACKEMVIVSRLAAASGGATQLIYVGSTVSHPLIQAEMSKWCIHNALDNHRTMNVRCAFLKNSGYYGAIGALLKAQNKEEIVSKDS
ncbi:unnamed protein product [Owenia fusiformis]|uniref:Uncharacterized protein n=1 Tax=Owenia fusiformis TaxID=6347 RepID=A0A8J1XWS8_OWEFU|nr:unnamed protein product [Owenia fusiformis]